MEQKYIDKFMSYVSPEALTGCWLWTGGFHRQGYGLVSGELSRHISNKTTITAHRASAIIHGLNLSKPVIRHLCDNPSCVNPMHLESGTQQDNMNDMKYSIKYIEKQAKKIIKPKPKPRNKLQINQVLEIRAKHLAGISKNELGRTYNVNAETIRQICNRKIWKHV